MSLFWRKESGEGYEKFSSFYQAEIHKYHAGINK